MKNLARSLSKYTGLSVDELEKAFEAVQDDVREEVEDYFHLNTTVEEDCGDDGKLYYIHADEFFDYLFENFRVEPK